MNQVDAGLQVMLYGLGGVFAVLILFYLLTKAMVVFSGKASADK